MQTQPFILDAMFKQSLFPKTKVFVDTIEIEDRPPHPQNSQRLCCTGAFPGRLGSRLASSLSM